jgi:hypothetical protein
LATGGLSSSDEYVKLRARLDGVACAACGRDEGRKGDDREVGDEGGGDLNVRVGRTRI